MKIIDIYEKFATPPNLQQHLFRVATIVLFLQKHWMGEGFDWQKMVIAALLHDLGNIVRFDFDNHPELLGEELKILSTGAASRKTLS